ncbi:hypothetical protein PENTCL1PPCAC_12922, partial [Pristionchus entomophagus]
PTFKEITYPCQVLFAILACIFNVVLIFIVQRSTNRDIGTYRILITYFALSDLYYTIVHFVVYPIPENYGNAFFVRGHGYYRELLGIALYFGAYGHAFPILIFHFLYRLLAIKHPQFLRYFSFFLFALIVTTAVSNAIWFSIFYWFFHPDSESLRILTPIFNGSIPLPVAHYIESAEQHAQAVYWTLNTYEDPRWRNLCGALVMGSCMATSYTIIVYCCFRINGYLKERLKSAKAMLLHHQLFRSLMYQSFVPLLTAYLPAGTSVIMPVFGFPIISVALAGPYACATHPLFDPIVLILTITEFRLA